MHMFKQDSFRADFSLREVQVVEYDRYNKPTLIKQQLSITKDPLVFTTQTADNIFLRSFMGSVFFTEDEIIDRIDVYRENLMESIALVGGFNCFFLLLMWGLFKCCVSNQFHASLRREIRPSIVEAGDRRLMNNPSAMLRRKMMSGTSL